MRSLVPGRPRSPIVLLAILIFFLLPVWASIVYLTPGEVETSGEAPILTKTGTLIVDNAEPSPLENVRAVLQESEDYTIVDGTVEFPSVDPNTTLESTDTYSIEVDVSKEGSRSLALQWSFQYDLDGNHNDLAVGTIVDIPEFDDE